MNRTTAEATRNTTWPIWYSLRRPMRSPTLENGSSTITSTSWYTVTTLVTEALVTLRSLAIVGMATLAMAPSITNSAVPNEIAAIAQ